MPSVTEVLDYSCPPFLVKWFKKNTEAKCEKIAKETADCGQEVNRLIDVDIETGSYPTPSSPDVLNCLSQWESLKADHPEFVPSVREMQVELRAFGVIGHPDFVNQTEKEWGITDLKCTNGIRTKNWIQEAQYARMIMDMRGWSLPSFLRTIRLPRDGAPYEWVEIRDQRMIQSLMRMFDGYLEVFYSDKIITEFFRQQQENLALGEF